MNEYPTTLAAFKRFLSSGGSLTLRAFSWDEGVEEPHRYKDVTRTSGIMQTEKVMLTPGESWLSFGKAGDWTFEGNMATVHAKYGPRMTYEMGAPT